MLVGVDLVTWLLSGVVRLGVVKLDWVLLDRAALGRFLCFLSGDLIVGIERLENIELVLIVLFGGDDDDLGKVYFFGRLLRTLFLMGFLLLDEAMMLIWEKICQRLWQDKVNWIRLLEKFCQHLRQDKVNWIRLLEKFCQCLRKHEVNRIRLL